MKSPSVFRRVVGPAIARLLVSDPLSVAKRGPGKGELSASPNVELGEPRHRLHQRCLLAVDRAILQRCAMLDQDGGDDLEIRRSKVEQHAVLAELQRLALDDILQLVNGKRLGQRQPVLPVARRHHTGNGV